MSTAKELKELLDKSKESNRELRKENKELKKESKEKDLHIKFLTERLAVWADRNFDERQKVFKMTLEEFLEISKNKPDFAKDRELAEIFDRQKELSLDSLKVDNGEVSR